MKRTITYLAIGLFLVGVTGIAQAAGYFAGNDFQAEGPPNNYGSQKKSNVPTKVVLDQGSRYIEGMGFAPSAKEKETVVAKVPNQRDWCYEGLTAAEIEMHFKNVNKIEPAAGN